MKTHLTLAIIVSLLFVFAATVPAPAADSRQAVKSQNPAQPAAQASQDMKPLPTVNMTPLAAPKGPNFKPIPPQSGPSQKDILLKQAEDRKRQEKEREKMRKDAKMVQIAPSKGKTATAGQNAQSKSLNRTAYDLGTPKR